ncbi:MAG: TonB-dependent receptor, partial [Lentisphaerae bacterium]|nr:TonB-dependent receptor [Lentisphaerota bacterium]
WTRRIYYRFAGAEDAHTARLETIGRLGDALTLTAGYSWKDFGDLEGGGEVGTQEKTGYDERDWDAKLEYDPGGGGRLVLAHQNVELDDAWRTHKTIYGIGWEGLTVGDELRRVLDQERELTYVQYRREARGGPVETLEAGVSYQRQAEDRERVRTRDRYDVQGFEDGTLGAFMHARSPSALGSLVYGVEYYRDDVDSFQRNLNPDGSVKSTAIQGPVGDAAAYDLLGVYLQDELRPAERVSVLVGGRYEFARADADAVEDPATGDRMSVSGDWDDVVGSARMLYALDAARTWTLFAGVSQGFRAPNLSDLTRLDTARTDEIETPSPGLDPEHFTAYEAGLKAAAADLSAQVAYYYTDIDGMIVRTPTGNEIDGNREVTKQNGGDGYVQGFEADGRWRVGAGVTAFGAFTWMYGEVETFPTSDPVLVTEYMDRLMPPTGRLGVRWARARRYWIEAACTMAGKADKLSTRDAADTSRIPPGGTPGYVVYDVRAGWKPLPDLALSLAVENVTDADYRIHGSGVNEPGRNVVLTADWVF